MRRGKPWSPSFAWMVITNVPIGLSSLMTAANEPWNTGGRFWTSFTRISTPAFAACIPSWKIEREKQHAVYKCRAQTKKRDKHIFKKFHDKRYRHRCECVLRMCFLYEDVNNVNEGERQWMCSWRTTFCISRICFLWLLRSKQVCRVHFHRRPHSNDNKIP